MKIIPSIDIRGGKVVRLIQGNVELETVYSDSPIKMAQQWLSYGVDTLHIVDLDGAISGKMMNFEAVKEIANKLKVKVEFGGGIRDEETILKVLSSGIDKVVIGTKALDENFMQNIERKFREKIVVGIDAKRGIVHTKGWLFPTSLKAIDLAKKVEEIGIKTINYTDISKDGTLEGPNVKSLEELLRAVNIDVIASGGISTIDDLKKLKNLEQFGLRGVIIGKALYENTIDLREAIKALRGK